MAVKPGKKSIGGSPNGATPKTPDNKRKSLPKPGAPPTPMSNKKAPPPAPAATPKKEVNKGTPEKKPQGISAQLNKVSNQSKGINKNQQQNKKNKNKNKNKNKQGAGGPKPPQQQQQKGPLGPADKKAKKKARRLKLQEKLATKARSPMSQSRAYKAEQEMNHSAGRVLTVKLADPPINKETITGWSTNIENALFPRPVEPRSFTVVLKAGTDVKKEVEKLKKISFAGGKLVVEERKMEGGKADQGKPEDSIDPYTLYLTNLDQEVTRQDLQDLFKNAHVMNPRKHHPKIGGRDGSSKFAFIGFDSADAALDAFKMCFNKSFKGGRAIIVRFRRISRGELVKAAKQETPTPAVQTKAEPNQKNVKKEEQKKKGKPIKQEPAEEEDDDEDEDDDMEEEEEDDDEGGMEVDEEEDDDEDDSDDGLNDEDDDDDDDDDE